jgi:hypothetical protein
MNVIVYLQGVLRENLTEFLSKLGEVSSCVSVCEAETHLLSTVGAGGREERELLITDSLDPLILLEAARRSPQVSLLLLVESITALEALPAELYNHIVSFVITSKGEMPSTHLVGLVRHATSDGECTLERYFGSRSVLQRVAMNSGAAKTRILDDLSNMLLKLAETPGRGHLRLGRERIVEVLDELLMNAVFHANPRFRKERPHLDFTLDPKEEVEAHWILDGDLFGLSVVDKFGSLDRASVVRHLVGTNEKLPIDQRRTAGLGLRMIFKRAEQFVISVTPRVRAEVICLFNVGHARSRTSHGKSKGYLHLRGSSSGSEGRERMTRTQNGGVVVEIDLFSHQMVLRGILNESVTQDFLEQAILSANQGGAKRILVDFSNVTRANSCGIARWLQAASRSMVPLTYTDVPSWLLEQFLMIEEFSRGDVFIESVVLPFYCVEDDLVETRKFFLGKEIPLQKDYSEFSFDFVDGNGKNFVVNFEVDAFLELLSEKADAWTALSR